MITRLLSTHFSGPGVNGGGRLIAHKVDQAPSQLEGGYDFSLLLIGGARRI